LVGRAEAPIGCAQVCGTACADTPPELAQPGDNLGTTRTPRRFARSLPAVMPSPDVCGTNHAAFSLQRTQSYPIRRVTSKWDPVLMVPAAPGAPHAPDHGPAGPGLKYSLAWPRSAMIRSFRCPDQDSCRSREPNGRGVSASGTEGRGDHRGGMLTSAGTPGDMTIAPLGSEKCRNEPGGHDRHSRSMSLAEAARSGRPGRSGADRAGRTSRRGPAGTRAHGGTRRGIWAWSRPDPGLAQRLSQYKRSGPQPATATRRDARAGRTTAHGGQLETITGLEAGGQPASQ